jgi:hypothetical protein
VLPEVFFRPVVFDRFNAAGPITVVTAITVCDRDHRGDPQLVPRFAVAGIVALAKRCQPADLRRSGHTPASVSRVGALRR